MKIFAFLSLYGTACLALPSPQTLPDGSLEKNSICAQIESKYRGSVSWAGSKTYQNQTIGKLKHNIKTTSFSNINLWIPLIRSMVRDLHIIAVLHIPAFEW